MQSMTLEFNQIPKSKLHLQTKKKQPLYINAARPYQEFLLKNLTVLCTKDWKQHFQCTEYGEKDVYR